MSSITLTGKQKMTSKEQFRALFAQFEPELLGFLEGVVQEFGIKNLKIYCAVPKGATTRALPEAE